MNTLFSTLLKQYDPENQELILKARFVLLTTLIILVTQILAMAYTTWLIGINNYLILGEAAGFLIMLCALFLLIKGHFIFAIHTIFLTGFTVCWFALFNREFYSHITKLDTIVFVIALMTTMPIMFFRSRKPMILYFVVNLGVLFGFVYYLGRTTDLSYIDLTDYLLDNTIAMGFVFTVSYNLFAIHRQVLKSIRKELLERQKAEKDLEELRILLSSTINSMPSVIIGVNKNLEILLWNEEAVTLTGVDHFSAMGQSLLEIAPQLSNIKGKINQVMADHTISREFKNSMVFSSMERVMDITIYPIPEFTMGGAVIRLDDASERIRMETVMVQSEKMLSLGGLAAGMAHELNNPLAGMIQSTQVIENRLVSPMAANKKAAETAGISLGQIKTYLENRNILTLLSNVNEAGIRAAKIVENMLGFVKKTDTPMEKQDLVNLMEEAITLAQSDYDLKKRYDFKHIKILREFQSNIPQIFCEKNKIQQVIFNILKNASQAMAGFGPDKTPQITLSLYTENHQVCMVIQDNGPGMEEETRKRIFDPFFTTKPVDQGTGLGLSVSYFIITEDHGGTMEVDSVKGKGTGFRIGLPMDE